MGRKTPRDGCARAARARSATLTQYSYDAAGRLDCTAVRMNPAAFALAAGLGLRAQGRRARTAPTGSPATSTTRPASALQLREGVGSDDRGGRGDLGL